MWLMTVLLALMASGSACPNLCECHPGRLGSPKRISCLGKSSPAELLLLLLSPSRTNVTRVSLSGSDEAGITSFLVKFENDTSRLESLELTNCSLCALNVSWIGFENLRELNVSGNSFLDIRHAAMDASDLANLANLTLLDASNNLIEVLGPDAFRALESLAWMRLRGNVISKIEENGFTGLQNLEYLDLADNKLGTIPSGALAPLDSLQKLDLSGNKLQVLGAGWFETLARLRELDVSRNGLARAASGALQPLPGLSVLRLAENPLRERDLSLLLGTGRRLETVDASRTGLVRVPAALTRSVRALRLAGNKLMSIRSGDLDSYPLLRLLDLSSNRLTDVEEDALGRLEALQELDISGNILSSVPRSLPNALTSLELANNAISLIKFNDLQGLYNLLNLTLRDNAISAIEEGSFSQLPALVKLDISNNPIKLLSTNTLNGPYNLAILRMSGLSQLEKRGNEKEAGDMAFPVQTPERLVVLDISHSPVLATQLLADDAALSACKSLLELNLAHSNVTTIRSDLAYVVPQLRTLGLSGNDWNCSAEQYWLGEWLRQHEELKPRAQCGSPDEMSSRYLREMPPVTSTTSPTTVSPNRRVIINSTKPTDDRERSITEPTSSATSTLISRKVENAIRDPNGIPTVSDSRGASPTRHSIQVMRPGNNTSIDSRLMKSQLLKKIMNGKPETAGRKVLPEEKPTNGASDEVFLENSIMSNDITKTIAEELNGQVTAPGSRLAESFSGGAHPGMLVLVGAALGAAALLTLFLSRRATAHNQDQYHRHENIEVHSLTPTTELW